MYLLNTKGGPIPWPGSVATSPAVPGRRIGRMNGLDLAFPDHFAKKLSNFSKINSQSNFPALLQEAPHEPQQIQHRREGSGR